MWWQPWNAPLHQFRPQELSSPPKSPLELGATVTLRGGAAAGYALKNKCKGSSAERQVIRKSWPVSGKAALHETATHHRYDTQALLAGAFEDHWWHGRRVQGSESSSHRQLMQLNMKLITTILGL